MHSQLPYINKFHHELLSRTGICRTNEAHVYDLRHMQSFSPKKKKVDMKPSLCMLGSAGNLLSTSYLVAH
uniref:Uncharacterized protein n=1 Tax=Arundo donax TaxID=35708 RepID=A0A0A9R4L2_ARUDO